MIRLTIVFDNMRQCSSLFDTYDHANDFAIALMDLCEEVNSIEFVEVEEGD